MLDTLWQDLKYGARSLARSPGFTAIAVLTLALGIGVNTAIFSVVYGVVLKPLSYGEPDRIVRVWPQQHFSKELLDRFAGQTRSFAAFAGYGVRTFPLTGDGSPEEILGTLVTPHYFTVMGAQPVLGRDFRSEESRPGAEPVVILSHGLWQRRFGGDPRIAGRTIEMSGVPRTIVGVMHAAYRPLAGRSELWVPMIIDPAAGEEYTDELFYRALARLSPGVTLAQAADDVRRVALDLGREQPDFYPDEAVRLAGVTPLHDDLVGDVRPILLVLLGAVGAVLLVACGNVANMLLARAGSREREIAVRFALGAGRMRIVRQLLTESSLLGLLGGATGVFAALWSESVLLRLLPASVPRAAEIGIDLPEVLFAAAVSLLAVLLFGMTPALRTTRSGLHASLQTGGRGAGTEQVRHRLNRGLIVTEIAVSVIMVVGAGLLLKSLWRMLQVEPGFRAEEVVSMRLSPPADRYPPGARQAAYYRQVVERVGSVPGVVAAGAIDLLPMTPTNTRVGFSAEDNPIPPGSRMPMANFRLVVPGYFRTLGIPLLRGRTFTASDRADARQVGLINRSLARRLWPDGDPIGKRIMGPEGEEWFTIVGVVGDIQQHRLDRIPEIEMYRPFAQEITSLTFAYLTLRVDGEAALLMPAIQSAIWSVDGEVPISRVATMREVISRSLAQPRFFALLLTAFAGLALGLGALGVYGVGSYAVSRRTREIGVRVALGAAPGMLVRSVLAREMVPVGIGMTLGVLGALAVTRVLSSFLFDVSATDPLTFLAVALFLALVALVAGYIPARRAARVDPMVALRSE